jgi:hypothetical protein
MPWKPTQKLKDRNCTPAEIEGFGGIIVVDFVDMKVMENKKKLADAMEQFMRPDRSQTRRTAY